jgi:RND superfamily putative drug exporter
MADNMNASESDLLHADLIALPILLVALFFIFGGLRAALLPIFAALAASAGSFIPLLGVTYLTSLASYALDVVMLLGLGLAVDYSLLMVNRFREARAAGADVAAAVEQTAATAGRTVTFSALTVATSLSGLFAFGDPGFTSVAVAGIATALVALAAAWIAVAIFALLFLMTGSVLIPLKALVMNTLSLGAMFGALVWVFQDGHLASMLGFTAFGAIEAWVPVVIFTFAFGLSMDYEVFVMSRIKELHDQGMPSAQAVPQGLARTGRIVSTAAGLLAVSFFAFGTSTVSFLQMFGIGTGLAILIDATLIRGVLVPAAMRVLGPAAWYSPAPLRRVYTRVALNES